MSQQDRGGVASLPVATTTARRAVPDQIWMRVSATTGGAEALDLYRLGQPVERLLWGRLGGSVRTKPAACSTHGRSALPRIPSSAT